ncbi:hypothetical protein COO60DRAFT_558873 [Scenedesmus sp. NREL 46B-D3]|nr:hypothetical protein COO60DRAFT_558873 [Scenedesmus sp. NREL 46B-D3]
MLQPWRNSHLLCQLPTAQSGKVQSPPAFPLTGNFVQYRSTQTMTSNNTRTEMCACMSFTCAAAWWHTDGIHTKHSQGWNKNNMHTAQLGGLVGFLQWCKRNTECWKPHGFNVPQVNLAAQAAPAAAHTSVIVLHTPHHSTSAQFKQSSEHRKICHRLRTTMAAPVCCLHTSLCAPHSSEELSICHNNVRDCYNSTATSRCNLLLHTTWLDIVHQHPTQCIKSPAQPQMIVTHTLPTCLSPACSCTTRRFRQSALPDPLPALSSCTLQLVYSIPTAAPLCCHKRDFVCTQQPEQHVCPTTKYPCQLNHPSP